MKTDKSCANWMKQDIKDILALIARYVRANETSKNCQKGAFGIITKY